MKKPPSFQKRVMFLYKKFPEISSMGLPPLLTKKNPLYGGDTGGAPHLWEGRGVHIRGECYDIMTGPPPVAWVVAPPPY